MDAINEIAARHGGIPVIEDAAQSFGASYGGGSGATRKSCHLSTIGCTSFFPSKPLGCYGDGGAVFTDDDGLATALREIRVHGQSRRYVHTRVGVGGRMDTLQCAIVLAKLRRFDWELERRRGHAAEYSRQLAEADVALPVIRPGRDSAWAQYTVMVEKRDEVQGILKELGVPTAVHYPVPLDEQPAYRDQARGYTLPISRAVSSRVLSLPMSADLTDDDVRRVVSAVASAQRN
jgi:UDP-2-acetamido-2-deoxy-ribo-hexuluronate aminotransferase